MTNEELAARVQAGERDLLEELWAQNRGLISMLARRRHGLPLEDLEQSGYFAVVAAAETYNPAAGAKFTTWLSLRLRTAFAEAGGSRTPAHSLDEPIGEDGAVLGELIPDPDSTLPFEAAERRVTLAQVRPALARALGELTPEQREVIRRRYWLEQKPAAIAAELGATPAEVRRREAQALRILRHPRNSLTFHRP